MHSLLAPRHPSHGSRIALCSTVPLQGKPVSSLKRLKEMAESTKQGTLSFRLDSGEMIVLSARQCWESEAAIFRTHRIPHRASADLR
jgi:hypothetical protein